MTYPSESTLLKDLFLSEQRYFETGSTTEALAGCRITSMDGMETLAAGCIIHQIQQDTIVGNLDGWLQAIENRLSSLGFSQSRLYLQCSYKTLERCLTLRGYYPSVEVALLMRLNDSQPLRRTEGAVKLRAVDSNSDWHLKLAFHKQVPLGPDGHENSAELWVEMEKRKNNLGYMKSYLVYIDDEICGAVSAAACENIIRLKNLVIHPRYRRQGVGRQVAELFGALAKDRGKSSVGCFAIRTGPALGMYQQAGFSAVSQQTEWVKPLALSTPTGRW